MSTKSRSLVLVIVGALLAVVALGADALGVGAHPGMGWKQITGAVVGAAVAVAGALGLRRG
jgi:hypothetical protein